MKKCLHAKSVMDSSKNPIQNVLTVEPSLKMKKKKLLNRLVKDLQVHRRVDLRDLLDPDHLGRRKADHLDHPRADLRRVDHLDQRKVDRQGQRKVDRQGQAREGHQGLPKADLRRADHLDQRRVDHQGQRKADPPDQSGALQSDEAFSCRIHPMILGCLLYTSDAADEH